MKSSIDSIQGEGFWTGTPMVFVRFSGCNLKCKFCDTVHESYTEMTVDDILKEISKYPSYYICITGGEPLVQLDSEMLDAFIYSSRKYHLETNGGILIDNMSKLRMAFRWITVSPKGKIKEDWYRFYMDELKVIYKGKDVNSHLSLVSDDTKLYLQPLSMKNIKETIEYVKEHSRWNLSIQTQKLLNIR